MSKYLQQVASYATRSLTNAELLLLLLLLTGQAVRHELPLPAICCMMKHSLLVVSFT
jgi:hypothetical protein